MPDQFCKEHSKCITDIQNMKDDIKELKDALEKLATKDEVKTLKENINIQIVELKADSEKHFNNTKELAESLARLEENMKTLKDAVDRMTVSSSEQTEKMLDRMDKIYERIVNFKFPQEDNNKEHSMTQKDDANIEKRGFAEGVKWFFSNKVVLMTITVILLLVALISYLVTGHWVNVLP
jgi:seryl-tRNA synthetase